MTHKTKDCVERPRKIGAKYTKEGIGADEKIQQLHLETFDAKKDRWNGYDTADYGRVMDM
jgi:pre-mRNA-processing factor SLU7